MILNHLRIQIYLWKGRIQKSRPKNTMEFGNIFSYNVDAISDIIK
jgi:hypothetical protein